MKKNKETSVEQEAQSRALMSPVYRTRKVELKTRYNRKKDRDYE